MATADDRVVAGALVGSLAHGEGDRWSDVDITFAVADGVAIIDVLEDWSASLVDELHATKLFDLSRGAFTYRVFVLPDSLELDLSFAPAPEFGPLGPAFTLLFGEAGEQPPEDAPAPPGELFGLAVHHALHARACIERGRSLQAEFWITVIRHHARFLACERRGLDGNYGRDFDRLPPEVKEASVDALVRSLDPAELRRALRGAVALLLQESVEVRDVADKVEPLLRELTL
jgi:hypothetical protein